VQEAWRGELQVDGALEAAGGDVGVVEGRVGDGGGGGEGEGGEQEEEGAEVGAAGGEGEEGVEGAEERGLGGFVSGLG